MSIKTKFAALALATLAVTGTIASAGRAQANPLGWGIGAGLVGAADCRHRHRRQQRWLLLRRLSPLRLVRQFDAFGNYVGRVRTCGY